MGSILPGYAPTVYEQTGLTSIPVGKADRRLLKSAIQNVLEYRRNTAEGQLFMEEAIPHLKQDPALLLDVTADWLCQFYWGSTPIAIQNAVLTTKLPLYVAETQPHDFTTFVLEGVASFTPPDLEKWSRLNLELYPQYLKVLTKATFLMGTGPDPIRIVGQSSQNVDLSKCLLCGTTIEELAPLYPQIKPLFEGLIDAVNRAYNEARTSEPNSHEINLAQKRHLTEISYFGKEIAQAFVQNKLKLVAPENRP